MNIPKKFALITLSLFIFLSCDVYNEELLEHDSTPTKTIRVDSSKGDTSFISDALTELPVSEDSTIFDTTPSGGTQEILDICGDGKVTGSETCDIALLPDNPDSCLFLCSDIPPCFSPRLNTNPCRSTECFFVKILECSSGDGCCPDGCTHSSDQDCLDNAVEECPTECEDDGDPCTIELFSPDECNIECARSIIKDTIDNDDCCPNGATANDDNDCPSICGNNEVEPKEECDGDPLCDDNCKSLVRLNERACVQNLYGRDFEPDCAICICSECSEEIKDCLETGPPTEREGCGQLVVCGYENRCLGRECLQSQCLSYIIGEFFTSDEALQEGLIVGECVRDNCQDICFPRTLF